MNSNIHVTVSSLADAPVDLKAAAPGNDVQSMQAKGITRAKHRSGIMRIPAILNYDG